MKKFFIIFIFIQFSVLLANDGGYRHGSGGMVIPVDDPAISMESEIIDIHVYKKDRYSYQAEYKCRFIFKNSSSIRQRILIGFPVEFGILYNAISPNLKTGTDLGNFTVSIKGSEIPYTLQEHAASEELHVIPEYDAVYRFYADFEPYETLEIFNSFETSAGSIGDLHPHEIKYILLSGLTWKKPIGSAKININFEFPVYEEKYGSQTALVISPSGYITQTSPLTMISYRFRNFKPEADIKIHFSEKPEFPYNSPEILNQAVLIDEKFIYSSETLNKYNLYYDYDYIYKNFISRMSQEQIKILRYSILAWNGFRGRNKTEAGILERYFYSNPENTGFVKNELFDYRMLKDEEILLFNHLGRKNLKQSPFDYDYGIRKIISAFEKTDSRKNLIELETACDEIYSRENLMKETGRSALRKAFYTLANHYESISPETAIDYYKKSFSLSA